VSSSLIAAAHPSFFRDVQARSPRQVQQPEGDAMMGSSPSIDARFTHAVRCGRATCLTLLTVCLLAITASAASAETLMMPNRDMLMGTSQVVWGVSTLPNNTSGSPTTYSINFGDGSVNAAGTVTDRSFIAFNHTFAIAGTFTVTLQVSNQQRDRRRPPLPVGQPGESHHELSGRCHDELGQQLSRVIRRADRPGLREPRLSPPQR